MTFAILEMTDDEGQSMLSCLDLDTVPAWAMRAQVYGLRGLFDSLKEMFEHTYQSSPVEVLLSIQDEGDPEPLARYAVHTVEKHHGGQSEPILDKQLAKALQGEKA